MDDIALGEHLHRLSDDDWDEGISLVRGVPHSARARELFHFWLEEHGLHVTDSDDVLRILRDSPYRRDHEEPPNSDGASGSTPAPPAG